MIDMDITLVIQIINMIVLMFFLNKVLYTPVRAVLKKRAEKLQGMQGEISKFEKNAQLRQEEVDAKKALAAGTEKGKAETKLEFEPQIRSAIATAEAEAKEKGEVFTDLARLEAGMPGLKETVSELKELATIATSTLGGRAFDAVVKESGFGATEGGTARAKFIAIVSNQVLPLLRVTFGAAFTAAEGDSLRATMGDPNATPEAKMAALDAFVTQKERNIREKQTQLGEEDLTTLSTDQLIEMRKQAQ